MEEREERIKSGDWHLRHGSLGVRSTIRGHPADSIRKLGRAEKLDVCYLLSFVQVSHVCWLMDGVLPALQTADYDHAF